MKIAIPGGTGQVGTLLARAFHADGHEVTVFGRSGAADTTTGTAWRVLRWDPTDRETLGDTLDGMDVVINLAGRSVNCRYTPKHRREILQSRVDSVHTVARAVAEAQRPPALWLQASTATIYAHTYDRPNDETSGVLGGNEPGAPDTWRFSIDVAKAWEQAFVDAVTPHTRKIALRSALIMNHDRGSIFDTLLTLVRRGLGGTSGNGRQYVSWIHETDFVQAMYFLIAHTEIDGVVNVSSPHPVPNAEFMRTLRRAWGMPIGLPANRWMLEVGALFLRTETELLLKSRRVIPGRLLQEGFSFRYPEWNEAARDLCQRWKTITES